METWTIELPIAPTSRKEAEDIWGEVRSRVGIGDSFVSVKGINAPDQESARKLAVDAVNRLLDQLSVLYGAAHEVVGGGQNYKIIREGSDVRQGVSGLRMSVILTDEVQMRDRLTIEKRDASGNLISVHDSDRHGILPGVCAEAMKYYRRGALAGDVYECLRNKCLAIESVASLLCRRDGFADSREAERWLHTLDAAYADAQRRRDLGLVWPAAASAGLRDLADYLYKDVRCQLSHGKDDKARRLPYRHGDVEAMDKARDVVDRVALDLIQFQLHCGL